MKPKSFRYTQHCKFCCHSRLHRELFQSLVELYCDKHDFLIETYDVTSKVCDDFKDEDAEEQ
jgi:hypothetical protein